MDGQRRIDDDATDGQRTDDDDGTDGRTEDDDGDGGTDTTGQTDDIYIRIQRFKYSSGTKILIFPAGDRHNQVICHR